MSTEANEPPPPKVGPAAVRPGVSPWPMWVLGLVIMIDQADQNIVRGVIPQLQAEFGINDGQVGLLLSIFVLVNGLITVPAGYLADRWHRTRTIGHTVIAWSAITMVTAAAQNFGQLLLGRAVLGFGQAITEPSANGLISDFYPTTARARAFSLQQILGLVGAAIGIGLGGALGDAFGWQWAFIAIGPPGFFIALIAYRLREPRRGRADRLHLGIEDDDEPIEHVKLFEHGIARFFSDMMRGLRQDMKVILAIPTLRYALAGVGGIPGLLVGGRVADYYATRIRGARVVIPAYCIAIGVSFFAVSYLRMPFPLSWTLELIGMFTIWQAIPGLRAGVADAVPAHLRGAGFGAFNIVSVILGAAAAPFVVGQLADLTNLRTALWIVTPPVYIGAYVLYQARNHLDEDAAKIFEAVIAAVQAEQAERDATGNDPSQNR